MKVLNLLTVGGLGGIEILNYDFGTYSSVEQGFAFLFGTGATYERMKAAGYKVYDLSNMKPKICLNRFKKLSNIAEEYDLIVVHHGDPYLKFFFNYLVAYKNKKGLVFIHSCWDDNLFFPSSKIKHFIGKKIFQKSMDIAQKVVFVSEAGKKSYDNNFKLKDNTTVIYNGIGEDKIIDGQSNVLSGSNTTRIVYVGRLENIKGVDLLIEAIGKIKDLHSVKVTIVGGGSQKKKLEELTSKLNLAELISFVGPQSDVKPYLKASDVFVYPSRCQEVFGISIVEAMAYGLICVANNVGGIPEVIEDSENGFLNITNDVTGLVKCLDNAIKALNSEKGEYISIKAKETAKNYSITNTCNKLDCLYGELVSNDDI